MRSLVLISLLLCLLVIGFLYGTANNLSAFMIGGFCLTPFLLIGFGWSLKGLFAGRRLALVESSDRERLTRPRERMQPMEQRRERISDASAIERTL